MSFQAVGKLEEFPDGRAVEVRIGARRIAIYRLGDRLFAVKNVCPHEGDSLHRALPENGAAVCRSHGWRFDLRTGRCLRGQKNSRIAVYPVKVEGDTVMIDVS